MIRAVLDANVYVSAVVRPEGPPGQIINRFLRGGGFEIVMSKAIVEEARRRSVPQLQASDFEALAGRGARATLDGKNVVVGGPRLPLPG